MGGEGRVEVVDEPDRERYTLRVDGEPAGLAEYRRLPDRTVLLHSEVDERFGGRGLGSVLVREALGAERAAGRAVEPRCPFVAHYIGRHPEFADLVPERFRGLLPD